MKTLKHVMLASVAVTCAYAAYPALAATTETKTMVTRTSNDADWVREDTYWQKNYTSRPYYKEETAYSTYEPAYKYGVEVYKLHPDKRFDELDETELRSGWAKARGSSDLDWDLARDATRDAYTHVYESRTEVHQD